MNPLNKCVENKSVENGKCKRQKMGDVIGVYKRERIVNALWMISTESVCN